MTGIIFSTLALVVSIISFLFGYFWNRKSIKMQLFAQMIEKESQLAKDYVHSKNCTHESDALISYFNFFDGLAHLYFQGMLPKDVTQKYFKTIVSDTATSKSSSIPEGCDELVKLLSLWEIKLD